jgi:hypothetical protein
MDERNSKAGGGLNQVCRALAGLVYCTRMQPSLAFCSHHCSAGEKKKKKCGGFVVKPADAS